GSARRAGRRHHRGREGHRPRARAPVRLRGRGGRRERPGWGAGRRGHRHRRRRHRRGAGGGRDHRRRRPGGRQRRGRGRLGRRPPHDRGCRRGLRRPPRPGEQRRDPARPVAQQHDRGGVGRRHPGPPEGPLRPHPLRRPVVARAAPGRAHGRPVGDQHVVDVGAGRQPRPDELRRRQGGHRRLHRHRSPGAAGLRGPGQRHRPRCQDPPHRGHTGARRPRAAATRAERLRPVGRSKRRAARGLPRLGVGPRDGLDVLRAGRHRAPLRAVAARSHHRARGPVDGGRARDPHAAAAAGRRL
ncbi:MAG: 3-oxoacyl-[acyl-carrier protein] reductase, partial [uncultured Acidimicrobiales bacterium]